MNLALITAKQVVVLFILIMSGFVCVKTKAVKIEGKKAFSDLLLYLVVPAMIIHSYIMDFNEEILCHNGAKYTAEALDSLIGGIQAKGYELVPISQLIIRDDFHMDTTGKQIAD